MLTLSRETIEDTVYWGDLGLHMEEFPFNYEETTEEELSNILEEMGVT